MSGAAWYVDDTTTDAATGRQPVLVNLHFLRSTLRRRWRTWVSLALLGLVLGAAWTVVVPMRSTSTVTLLLAHDPSQDPAQAMSTDVSMLQTRAVARSAMGEVGLSMPPEAFQQTVTATAVSSTVLVIEVSAPDDTASLARARALARSYLGFRAAQIRAQSRSLRAGYEQRVAQLGRRIENLTAQYDTLDAAGPPGQERAADVLAERFELTDQINSLRQVIEEQRLQSSSVISASYVLDPAAVITTSPPVRFVLATLTGLATGAAVGGGLVVGTALLSGRLRRREEIAVALGTPVRYGVGRVRARRGRWRGRGPTPRNLRVLVHGLETAVPPRFARTARSRKGRPTRLALATVDGNQAAALVLGHLGFELERRGLDTFLVDLSESGRLERVVTSVSKRLPAEATVRQGGRAGARPEDPVVFRPEGDPVLARGPLGAAGGVSSFLPRSDPRRAAWDAADVILILAEVDPAAGVDGLASWADEVVVLVTAGSSSAERLHTAAELLRHAGLQLSFAMLVDADPGDESLGRPDASELQAAPARRTS